METLKYLNINLKEATGFIYNEKDSYCGMAVQNLLSLYEDDDKKPACDFPPQFFKAGRLQVVTSLPPPVWNRLPISTHQVVTPDKGFVEDIDQAVKILRVVPVWSILNKFLGGVCVLKLKPSQRHKDTEITSLSVPVFPFISFISKKAGFHTPPLNVRSSSPLYLAENLLHEATHQALNLNLIERNILVKDYTTRSSPLVDIPWRKNQSIKRNKKWQVDRVLHACCVYTVVAFFRKTMLKKEKGYFDYDIKEALDNASYLLNKIQECKWVFRTSKILCCLAKDIKSLSRN